jgi:LuxR family transcriptional regulator, maltose regulon positive regulatory protein
LGIIGYIINTVRMPDLTPLIETKFSIPPARAELVVRARLYSMLETGARLPLLLVSAPPGFGKTTLVAAWLHSHPQPVDCGWLSLDEADNQPVTFWRYLTAALQHARPALGETAQAMLASSQPPSLEAVATALINELAASSAPLILVMDDYHVIRSKEIHASLNFLLDHLPNNLHLVLLSREDPPLGLARRRARQQMVEVRAGDLRFRSDETGSFLRTVMGLALDPQQVGVLEDRTEGWIAGLQMAGLSLQGRDPQAFLKSFAGVDHYIADYLVEEVLQRQPGGVREFLLKTSVLEVLSAPLCAALLENKPLDLPGPGGEEALASPYTAMLGYLEHANLFLVPLDNSREWYRYHHLFAQLLRQRLVQVYGTAEKAALHRRASDWFEAQHEPGRAIRQACQVPDFGRVVELIEAHAGTFFLNSEILQFLEWVNEIPAVHYQAHPMLCMAAAWASLATNQFPEAARWVERIETHLGHTAEAALSGENLTPAVQAALIEVLLVRVRLNEAVLPASQTRQQLLQIRRIMDGLPGEQACLFNTIATVKPVAAFNLGLSCEMAGDLQAAGKAFEEAAVFARQVRNSHVLHLALAHLANAQAVNGNLQAAQQVYQDALAQSGAPGTPGGANTPFTALAHAGLGSLYYEWNDLPAAQASYQAALDLARPWQNWESLIPATLGLSMLQSARGEPALALNTLNGLSTLPGGQQPASGLGLPLEAYRALLQAQILDGGRSHDAAAAWLRSNSKLADTQPDLTNEMALLDVARLLMLLERPGPALDLAQKVLASASHSGRQRPAVHARVLLAKFEAARGNLDQAASGLEEAVRLAQPEGYLRVFLDEGETIHRLLSALRSRLGPGDELAAYLRRILAAFEPLAGSEQAAGTSAGQPAGRDAVDPLSERENEILCLVAQGLTNQAIADRLVISLTTVKTHVGNIFLKLGVKNRTQAIATAESLGLLPGRTGILPGSTG